MQRFLTLFKGLGALLLMGLISVPAHASEADIKLPDLSTSSFTLFGMTLPGTTLLAAGLVVCVLGGVFGLLQYSQVKKLPAHESMLEISELIYETCKEYMVQQGRFLAMLELFIGAIIFYYFYFLAHMTLPQVILVLVMSASPGSASGSTRWPTAAPPSPA